MYTRAAGKGRGNLYFDSELEPPMSSSQTWSRSLRSHDISFQSVLAKTWTENILFSALLELTYRCNLNCFFCYNDLDLKGVPLSKKEYFRFLEDLQDMQVLNLSLSGGEPLAHLGVHRCPGDFRRYVPRGWLSA